MTIRYTKTESVAFGQTTVFITDVETGNVFPESESNRHYKEYKSWLDAGNLPEKITISPMCEVTL